MTMSRPLLLFLHIPKTAGSTLMQIIERQYSPEAILIQHQPTIHQALGALPSGAIDRFEVAMGHLWFGVHALVPRAATYITVLRDPIERVISHYYFVQQHPEHYLHGVSRGMSLEEYVTSGCSNELANDQTRLLAGGAIDTPSEMLAIAKQNLERHFAVVGLTEEFDQSLLLMQRCFGWRSPFYLKRNVTRHPSKAQLPAATLRVVEQHNQLDLELYRFARERFHARVRREGPAFEQAVRRFKRLNASYGKFQAFVSIATSKLRAGRPRTASGA